MAETANIGKLVVDMVLDPSKWQAGVEAVTAAAKSLVDGITKAADAVTSALSPAMDEAADGSEDLADAMKGTAKAADVTGAAVHDLAGVYVDASGKLRDASGKFVKDADVLKALGDASNLTAADLKVLQDRADKVKFEAASKSAKTLLGDLKEVADFAQGVVVRALQAASLAGGALVTASALVGADFEQKMKTVGVVAGTAGDQLGQLTEEARRLGASTTFSASEAADAMHVLASAGLDTGQIMAGAGKALVLAGAGGVDLELAASTLASTLSQFNMTADESGRVVDVLAKATAGSQFEVGDLSEALKYAAPTAASFGYSLEDTVAALAQFRDMGLQGSAAGTALRSVLSQASQQTKINSDTLGRYGLTLQDVNPQLHSFADILAKVGSVQMATADAMTVFGVESGGAFASLAEQMATGSTKLQDMQVNLELASGAAQTMYADMQQTVEGAFSELQGAGENVLLTLFNQYSDTLPALLESLAGFVNQVASAIEDRSVEIGGSLSEAFGTVEAYLAEHGADLAASFAEAIVQVAALASWLADMGTKLAGLLPYLVALGEGFAVLWVAQKVAAFASALSAVVELLGAAEVGVAALAAELTVASGGTFALVAAVGALVVGLTALIAHLVTTTQETRNLKAAQDDLNAKHATEDADRIRALDAILERQKAGVEATRQQLAASGELTAEKSKELDLIAGMSGADAARLESQGKLVEVAGELRTVAGIVQEESLEGYDAIRARVAVLGTTADDAKARILFLTDGLKDAKKMAESTNMATALAGLSKAAGEDFESIQAVEAAIRDLSNRKAEANQQITALDRERATAEAKILQAATKDQKDAYHASVVDHAAANGEKLKTEKDYTLNLRNLAESIKDENAGLDTALTDHLAAELNKRRRQIETEAQHNIEAAKGDSTKIAAIKAAENEALTDLDALYQRKRAGEEAAADKDRADKALAQRKELQDKLYAMEHAGDTESQKLEKEKADAIAAIQGGNYEDMLALAAAYDKKIADARARETADAEAASKARTQRERARELALAKDVVAAFKDVVNAVGSAVGVAFSALENMASKVLDLFASMTGFDFSLTGTVTDVISAQSTAADEGTTLSTADAVSQVMDGMFTEAMTFVSMLAEAAPAILDALVAGLPDLIDAFLAALPVVVDAIAAAIPQIVGLVVAALPGLVDALVAALPVLIDAILPAGLALIQAIIAELPTIMDALIAGVLQVLDFLTQNLDSIIGPLLDAALQMVKAIMEALPTLLPEIVALALDLVVAIIKALPDLITAILDALPDIIEGLITALVDALPDIIEALLVAIPDIILGLIDAIPDIILALVSAVPQIIGAVLAELPTIIKALVAATPQIAVALIAAIGDLISGGVSWLGDLASTIWEGLKDFFTLDNLAGLASAIGDAFVSGIKGAADAILDAIVDIFSAAWDWVTGLFGGDDSKKGRSASAPRTDTAGLSGALAGMDFGGPTAPAVSGRGGAGEAGRASRRAPDGFTAWTSITLSLDGQDIQQSLAKTDRSGSPTVVSASRIGHGGPAVGVSRGRFQRYGR